MAKYAIFSDVHANWEALLAVYRDFARIEGLHDAVCLGDLVGYGPNPNEVIAGLQSLVTKGYRVQCCLGNHDAAAIGRFEFIDLRDKADRDRLTQEANLATIEAIARQFRDPKTRKYIPVRYTAKASIAWTQGRLGEAARRFLASQCKDSLKLADDVLCVHGSPGDPLFGYITDARRAQRAYESPMMAGIRVCFLGHTHIPGFWQLGADDRITYAGKAIVMQPPKAVEGPLLELDPDGAITLVNVGSVGQPRDGDARAIYAVYDDAAETVELRRVPYDIAATRKKIIEGGLPELLAERLGRADAEKGVLDAEEEPAQ